MEARRLWSLLLVSLGMALLPGRAAAAIIPVTATVNGVANTNIGTINSTIDDTNDFMRSVFQLNAANRNLMNDAMGCQFRYVQIVTQDTDPNRPRDAAGNLPAIPYVDPPRGGYQGAGAGADNAPFYENDPGTGPFNYPNYDGSFANPAPAFPANTPVHEEANGIVRAVDFPTISANSAVTFETYIVYVNPELRAMAPSLFCVLAGFRWTVTRGAGAATTFTETTGNAGITDIRAAGGGDGAAITRINTAMANSGFNAGFAWQATTDCNLMPCVPEPSGLALVVIGGGLTVWRRRRLAAAA
jgi:hypothetical protein